MGDGGWGNGGGRGGGKEGRGGGRERGGSNLMDRLKFGGECVVGGVVRGGGTLEVWRASSSV